MAQQKVLGIGTKLLTQNEAIKIDEALMAEPGFSIDQLMELAGLSVRRKRHCVCSGKGSSLAAGGSVDSCTKSLLSSSVACPPRERVHSQHASFHAETASDTPCSQVAEVIYKEFPLEGARSSGKRSYSRILCICGPGNNGGDGLVAARHLKLWGYEPEVVLPRLHQSQLFTNLRHQMDMLEIPVHEKLRFESAERLDEEYDVILDAIFGFSFKGTPRVPFDHIIKTISESRRPTVSVDIPSGWDVELGPIGWDAFKPEVLVSLTAPKLCSIHFGGRAHYLGGRFLPPAIARQFGVVQPAFPGSSQAVKLNTPSQYYYHKLEQWLALAPAGKLWKDEWDHLFDEWLATVEGPRLRMCIGAIGLHLASRFEWALNIWYWNRLYQWPQVAAPPPPPSRAGDVQQGCEWVTAKDSKLPEFPPFPQHVDRESFEEISPTGKLAPSTGTLRNRVQLRILPESLQQVRWTGPSHIE